MSDADEKLMPELTPQARITFTLDGTQYEIPSPLPVRVWLRMFVELRTAVATTSEEWACAFGERVEAMLSWLTELSVEQLRTLAAEEYQRVLDALAEQAGKELADASPFSTPHQAAAAMSRGVKLLQAMAAGGEPASSSKSSAEVTGTQ